MLILDKYIEEINKKELLKELSDKQDSITEKLEKVKKLEMKLNSKNLKKLEKKLISKNQNQNKKKEKRKNRLKIKANVNNFLFSTP